MRTTIYCALLLILVLVFGCGKVAKGHLKQPAPKPSSMPLTNKVIGPAGGTMSYHDASSLYDNLEVIIPPGATTGPMTVTAEIPAAVVNDPVPSLPLELGPSGTFLLAVTVRIPYNPALIEPGDDPNDLIVVTRNANGTIEIIQGAVIDVARHTAEITTTHFSPFDVLFPRHFKLYRQPYRFVDGTPVEYAMGITYALQGTSAVKVYHPMLASNLSGRTLVLGKGTEQDFARTNQGNVIAIHGVFGSPPDFTFDAQGQPNPHDLRVVLQNNPKIQNLLFFQYQSGRSVDENAFAFANLFLQLVKPGCKCTIIGFSMGGLVAIAAQQRFGLSQYIDSVITLGTPHEGGSLHNATDYFAQYNATRAIVAGTIAGLGDIMIGSQFLATLNKNSLSQQNKVTINLVAANARDQNRNLLGHDGLVDTWSATSTTLGVPGNRILTVYGQWHGDLHMNADRNGVGKQTLEWIPGPNTVPTADAGLDGKGRIGDRIALDGSRSLDLDLEFLSYRWNQQGGPATTLTNGTSAQPSFVPALAGTYEFALIVNDGKQDSSADTVTVTIGGIIVTPLNSYFQYPSNDTFDARNNPAYNATNPTRATWARFLVGVDPNGTIFDATVEFTSSQGPIPPTATVLGAELTLSRYVLHTPGTVEIFDAARPGVLLGTGDTQNSGVGIDCTAMVQYHVTNGDRVFSFRLQSSTAFAEYYSGQTSTGWGIPMLRIALK